MINLDELLKNANIAQAQKVSQELMDRMHSFCESEPLRLQDDVMLLVAKQRQKASAKLLSTEKGRDQLVMEQLQPLSFQMIPMSNTYCEQTRGDGNEYYCCPPWC